MLALNHAEVVFIKQAEICYGVVELESGFTKSLFQVRPEFHANIKVTLPRVFFHTASICGARG